LKKILARLILLALLFSFNPGIPLPYLGFDNSTIVYGAKTPTPKPTPKPTATPTKKPTATPTKKPTATPTKKPTATPTVT
jgi:hypothetical protein